MRVVISSLADALRLLAKETFLQHHLLLHLAGLIRAAAAGEARRFRARRATAALRRPLLAGRVDRFHFGENEVQAKLRVEALRSSVATTTSGT